MSSSQGMKPSCLTAPSSVPKSIQYVRPFFLQTLSNSIKMSSILSCAFLRGVPSPLYLEKSSIALYQQRKGLQVLFGGYLEILFDAGY